MTRNEEKKKIFTRLFIRFLKRHGIYDEFLSKLNGPLSLDQYLMACSFTYIMRNFNYNTSIKMTPEWKVAEAKLRLDKLNQDRKAEEQRIRNEVFDAISAINLSFEKFQALERQVAKAVIVYNGERERFSAGDSTVFLVVERERQLNEAKIRMIDAEVEFHNGILALRAITAEL